MRVVCQVSRNRDIYHDVSVVSKKSCWRGVLHRTIGEKRFKGVMLQGVLRRSCRKVLWGSVVAECRGDVLQNSVGNDAKEVLPRSCVQACWRKRWGSREWKCCRMLQKNLGGGCRSVEEVLQRGGLKSFGGVLGMLHKGCMKDVTPEYYCISSLYIYIFLLCRFHGFTDAIRFRIFRISRKRLVDC